MVTKPESTPQVATIRFVLFSYLFVMFATNRRLDSHNARLWIELRTLQLLSPLKHLLGKAREQALRLDQVIEVHMDQAQNRKPHCKQR